MIVFEQTIEEPKIEFSQEENQIKVDQDENFEITFEQATATDGEGINNFTKDLLFVYEFAKL